MKQLKNLFAGLALCAPLTVAAQDIEINETNFPDANFRSYLLEEWYGEDGVITEEEIEIAVIHLHVSNRGIRSLQGIEYFTGLMTLSCSGNQLTTLDVSNNTALTSLSCDNNQLTTLDVSKNTALTSLTCFRNQIKGEAMDALISSLPENTAGNLYVYNNREYDEGNVCTKAQAAAVKAKGWTPYRWTGYGMYEYEGSGEGIVIDETNFPDKGFRIYLFDQYYGEDGVITEEEIGEITEIYTMGGISSLQGIEFFTELTTLMCGGNQLTSLDVSKNTALERLHCRNCGLTSLDVSKNTALTILACLENELTSLDVSKNTALTRLYCSNNRLTSLDVSKNPALEWLYCENNELTSLNVSDNIALTTLGCQYNQLTALDLSDNKALTTLECYRNQIKGEAMDALVSSLPETTAGVLYVYNESPYYDEYPLVELNLPSIYA